MKLQLMTSFLMKCVDEKFCKLNFKILIFTLFFLFGKGYSQKTTFFISLVDKKEYTPVVEKEFDITKEYTPYVQFFLPEKEKATGRIVVICPGGGYGMVAFGHEGTRWAEYFNDRGIAVAVLKYRLPKGNKNIPIDDVITSFGIIQKHAVEWNININQVGIMGFSAGGHLASTIATHIIKPFVPEFQILFYPVITMDKKYTHLGSHDNFLGKNASKEMEDLYSNEKQVTVKTPPAFIVLAQNDQVVPPDNGINYFRALTAKKVPATLHIYPEGNHGWGYSISYKYNAIILQELDLWLSKLMQKN